MKKVLFICSLLFLASCMKEKLYLADDEVVDMDENVYHSVTIGSQVWLKENLKTTRYNDNTLIPNVKESLDWAQLSSPAYCWYFNIVDRTNNKGILYNWYAVNSKKLCPAGYHVPSDAEWLELEIFIGMDPEIANLLDWRGDKLSKSLMADYSWYDPQDDDYGFSAIPAGFRSSGTGSFDEYEHQTDWWCADEKDQFTALRRSIVDYTDGIYRNVCQKNTGLSVRCIKN